MLFILDKKIFILTKKGEWKYGSKIGVGKMVKTN